MFPVTITLHDPAQLAAVMRALQPLPPDVAAPVEAAAAPAPKPLAPPAPAKDGPAPGPRTATAEARPAADAPAKTAVACAPAAAPAAAPSPASTAAAEPVGYPQVADAITRAVKVNRERTIDTLARFGARKGPELKAEQYAPFLAALAEALEEVAA